MSEPTYLIAFDIVDPDLDLKPIKEHIRTSPDIKHWWNYIPGLYLVTTALGADDITERLRQISGEASFLVIRVDPEDSQGWLPEKSWNWIKRRERERSAMSAKPA